MQAGAARDFPPKMSFTALLLQDQTVERPVILGETGCRNPAMATLILQPGLRRRSVVMRRELVAGAYTS
jgi:hypothetical protein